MGNRVAVIETTAAFTLDHTQVVTMTFRLVSKCGEGTVAGTAELNPLRRPEPEHSACPPSPRPDASAPTPIRRSGSPAGQAAWSHEIAVGPQETG